MKLIIFNISLVLTVFLGLLEPANIYAQESELTIIGNTKSVPSEMDMNQLKAVLKGERLRWDDGSKVVVALMKTSTPVGTNTCDRIFNMTGNQLNKYFLAMVFQGKINRPNLFNSEDELETFVAQTPGAIGVIQNTNDTQLITVMVDGKKQI
jgi:F0F1-type ATP synthase beta subunit